ncbi:hypothetical protein B0H10DRAFT_2444814 [Mycena sp. CBHHK59/15]|nr:hypothetical protein B0H10DRAFT_2444814 [Mycena sp. CBHHK59/15]
MSSRASGECDCPSLYVSPVLLFRVLCLHPVHVYTLLPANYVSARYHCCMPAPLPPFLLCSFFTPSATCFSLHVSRTLTSTCSCSRLPRASLLPRSAPISPSICPPVRVESPHARLRASRPPFHAAPPLLDAPHPSSLPRVHAPILCTTTIPVFSYYPFLCSRSSLAIPLARVPLRVPRAERDAAGGMVESATRRAYITLTRAASSFTRRAPSMVPALRRLRAPSFTPFVCLHLNRSVGRTLCRDGMGCAACETCVAADALPPPGVSVAVLASHRYGSAVAQRPPRAEAGVVHVAGASWWADELR